MKKQSKAKAVAGLAFGSLYVSVFLLVLLVTVNTLVGTLQKKQPAVFGYSVSRVLTSSMRASGFDEGDFVITKMVESGGQLRPGDIIAFYVHEAGLRPALPGDDRSDVRVIFHEIVAVDENGAFITKGSSNNLPDKYPVPFEAVSGVHVETKGFAALIIRLFLADNRFLYWVIGITALIALRQLLLLAQAISGVKLQNKVLRGRRNLLDKECFEKDIFGEFSRRAKKKLIATAPPGMGMLYDYLLRGRITKSSDPAAADVFESSRCSTADVLCLTYGKEAGSGIDAGEYIKLLPPRKRRYGKYRTVAQFEAEACADRRGATAAFFGCLAFSVVYFAAALLADSLDLLSRYEIIAAALLPLITLAFLVLVLKENRRLLNKLEDYLAPDALLPERYRFLLNHEKYSAEEIRRNAVQIEHRLSLGTGVARDVDNAVKDDEKEDAAHADAAERNDGPRDEVAAQGLTEIGGVVPERGSHGFLPDFKRRRTTFTERLKAADEACRERYSGVLNKLLGYRKVKSRVSVKFNTVKKGRLPLLRITARSKTLRLYFNLDPAGLPQKYRVKDMSFRKAFRRYPALLKVRSARGCAYALELIERLADEYGLVADSKYSEQDFAAVYRHAKALADRAGAGWK